jgi:hexosaminidase
MFKRVTVFAIVMFSMCCVPNACEAGAKGVISIIPRPEQLEVFEGSFAINDKTNIVVAGKSERCVEVGRYLQKRIFELTGSKLKLQSQGQGSKAKNVILLATKGAEESLGDEGYILEVTKEDVTISANKCAGLFYGVQSVLQLLGNSSGGKSSIPCVNICDNPRFKWRGMHLDVCRHYMPADFIKKYIDLLAMHKMNIFHWHLTEDQGWRIEIKKYPKLTEIGAWRDETLVGSLGRGPAKFDGKRHGGFYTQDEIREIVDYAHQRFVTIVPEIELPGHAQAAVSAYPEYSCTGGPFKVWTKWGVSENVYCAGNDKTFTFLEDVLTEVIDLFPGTYVHIGGDECPKSRWEKCQKCQSRIKAEGLKDEHELQSYFIKRIEKFLNGKGKRLIGWDEILEGGLAPNATVMSWRGTQGGIAAARAGHDVVMSPNADCYFDHYQSRNPGEPLAIGGLTTLKDVYHYEPIPAALTATEAKHVLGAQANVWTEYIPTPSHVEYMIEPRMSAMAEVVWTAKDNRNWDDFQHRMAEHYNRLDAMDVNYRVPDPEGFDGKITFTDTTTITINNPVAGAEIRYTLDGSEPTAGSSLYTSPIRVTKNVTLKAATIMPNGRMSLVKTAVIEKQKVHQAVEVENPQPGVVLKYFESRFNSIKDVSAATAVQTSVVDAIAIPPTARADWFALEFTGYIKIADDGVYTFYLTSDDGSAVYIADTLLVDNDGLHARQTKSGQIVLQKGYHFIKVVFFEATEAAVLNVQIQGPGITKRNIRPSDLNHVPGMKD